MQGKMTCLMLSAAILVALICGPSLADAGGMDRELADRVDLLNSEYPFGGVELTMIVGKMVRSSENPAETAVYIVLAFGASGARIGQFVALANAIDGMPSVKPAELQASVVASVEAGGDAVDAAHSLLGFASYLDPENQIAVGCGLAQAATSGTADASFGTSLRAAVGEAGSSVIGVAYDACESAAMAAHRKVPGSLAMNGSVNPSEAGGGQ